MVRTLPDPGLPMAPWNPRANNVFLQALEICDLSARAVFVEEVCREPAHAIDQEKPTRQPQTSPQGQHPRDLPAWLRVELIGMRLAERGPSTGLYASSPAQGASAPDGVPV